jgi:hypothetical protein
MIGGIKRKKTREQGGEIQRTEERTKKKYKGRNTNERPQDKQYTYKEAREDRETRGQRGNIEQKKTKMVKN